MIVRELMAQPVVVVREDATLEEVARTLLERRIGCVPVVNGRGELAGIVTESDFAAKERGFPFSPFSMYRHPQVLGRWLPREGVERIYREARTMTASAGPNRPKRLRLRVGGGLGVRSACVSGISGSLEISVRL